MEKGSHIGILGAGVEGRATANYLREHGYLEVTIFDEKLTWAPEGLVHGVAFIGGEEAMEYAKRCDVLFRSPGVKADRFKDFVGEMTSTTKFFMAHAKGKVIGVTGTKGKGTTSSLLYEILKEDGRDVYLGGNIGNPPLEFLDDLTDDSWTILEMSSFQLQDMDVSPHVAVVLMTTSEHMDYHADQAEYWDAKKNIARFQRKGDLLVLNADYEYAEEFKKEAKGSIMEVSRTKELKEGVHTEGPVILYCTPNTCEMIGQAKKVALPGPHNLENVMAAVAVARWIDVPIPVIQKVLYSFAGLPHRLELVKEVRGVKFYNDSFSTTPETCIAAAHAFEGAGGGGTHLICGGSEKHSDYSEWAKDLQNNKNVVSVFLIGVTADRMEEELNKTEPQEFPVKVYRCESLEQAVKQAADVAKAGEYVILSPAAASFDMFKNYKERGETFRKFVQSL